MSNTKITKPENKVKVLAPSTKSALSSEAELLISQAIDKKVPVETMQKLLEMRRELKAERAGELFNEALSNFQAECPAINKSKIVNNKDGTIRYRYAPLEEIIKQTKAIIRRWGFSYSIDAKVEETWVTAICKVTHVAGHSEVSSFKIPIDKAGYMNEPQKFASALTFAKRYSFCNAFGILTSDEDNDSNSIPQKAPTQVKKVFPVRTATPSVTTGKCPHCGTTNQYHSPTCPNNPKNQTGQTVEATPEQEKLKERKKPALNFQIAWIKSNLNELKEVGVITPEDERLIDFLSEERFREIQKNYKSKKGIL